MIVKIHVCVHMYTFMYENLSHMRAYMSLSHQMYTYSASTCAIKFSTIICKHMCTYVYIYVCVSFRHMCTYTSVSTIICTHTLPDYVL